MAWRRLSLKLQQADWFAAGVNLIGVLVGVLLAFQIDRWNEARRERREERAFLERLWDESQANLREARNREALSAQTVRELLSIHRALADPAALAALERTPDFGCTMLQLPAARLTSLAYQELVESDRLDILRDDRLKARLRRTLAEHEFVDGQLAYFRDAFAHYRSLLGPYHAYAVDVRDGGVDCSLRLTALRGDERARPTLSMVYRDQRRFAEYRANQARVIQAERDHLACVLGKLECPEAARRSPRR